ncbi:MAG: hypothetical protein AAB936_00690 [Patescibacteria group bacterium]
MNIAEVRDKCKSLIAKAPKDALILAILVLASSLSFGLGYLAGLDASTTSADGALNVQTTATEGRFVASKSGTKYYLPTCAGAERISDANKVWFVSASVANAAGYSPAANCEGL